MFTHPPAPQLPGMLCSLPGQLLRARQLRTLPECFNLAVWPLLDSPPDCLTVSKVMGFSSGAVSGWDAN